MIPGHEIKASRSKSSILFLQKKSPCKRHILSRWAIVLSSNIMLPIWHIYGLSYNYPIPKFLFFFCHKNHVYADGKCLYLIGNRFQSFRQRVNPIPEEIPKNKCNRIFFIPIFFFHGYGFHVIEYNCRWMIMLLKFFIILIQFCFIILWIHDLSLYIMK